MAWLKWLSVALFLACWILSRPKHSQVTITDIFVLALLSIFLPYFLFNPAAIASFNTPFDPNTVDASRRAIELFLASGCLVFLVRWRAGTLAAVARVNVGDAATSQISLIAAAFAGVIFVALLVAPEFRLYRIHTLHWLAGDMTGEQYQALRQQFSGGDVLDGVIGRLRFSVFPILFLLILAPLIRQGAVLRSALVAVLFFVALPLSLAKLPFVYFCGYVFLMVIIARPRKFTLKAAAVASAVGVLSTVVLMSLLYLIQYRGIQGYGSLLDRPISQAVDRIWGESYSIVLRYVSVYPDRLPFTGWNGIHLAAHFLGLAFRNPDIEVTRIALGADYGSNPGIYFLDGYAGFGIPGLLIYSLAGFVLLWMLDEIGNRLRTDLCYRVYFAIMAMNSLFLIQVALQTTLLSYGLAIVPVILFGLDRIALAAYRPSTEAHAGK